MSIEKSAFKKDVSKTIKFRMLAIFALLILVVVASSIQILYSLNAVKHDADVLNALGRQRMLTQAMGKSVLGYAMAKSRLKTIENQVTSLNEYITAMRASYTALVIPPAKKAGLNISMTPEADNKSIPFPATLARIVNERFVADGNISIDIVAETPANPLKSYQTEVDREAGAFLEKNKDKIFSKTVESDGKLSLLYYTADLATVEACAACHENLLGKDFKVGDMLGIRKMKIAFADNVAIGKAELNPSLDEYETAKTVFEKTLISMKSGGEYPLDLKMENMKHFGGIDNQDCQDKIVEVEKKFAEFKETVKTLLSADVGSNAYRQARNDILVQSNQLRKVSDDLVTVYADLSNKNQTTIRTVVIVSSIIILLIVVAMAIYLNRFVIRGINDTSKALKDIAEGEGDLTKRLHQNRADEIGELAAAFDLFAEKIHDIVLKVKSTAMNVNGAVSDISAAVQEQSAITAQQSSSVTEISSTVEELSITSSQIADNSQSVVHIADDTLKVVKSGVVAIGEIKQKMDEINGDNETNVKEIENLNKKSNEIAKVMEIINKVADQTKLIAFNSAIEASSAGEAGKRFGVVAVEIRNLADSVTESTYEIEKKIEEIQEAANNLVIAFEKSTHGISEGNELCSKTVEMLNNILKGAQKTTDSARQISLSTQQQKTASSQVVTALREISEGSKQTSASIKQTGDSSNNLKNLSDNLRKLVERFKLNSGTDASAE